MGFDMENLPDDWQVKPIREVTVRTSQRDPGKQPDKIFRYVDVSSVDNVLCKIRNVTDLKGSEAPSRARKDIRANDVLFATVRPTLKRVALIPHELDGEIASTGYCVLRANGEKVEPRFLYDCLITDWFIDAMGKLERGASYPAVRDSDVFNAKIPLPPLPEQQKIAGLLGVVQRAIEEQESLIQRTNELKKTLLHKLFTEGLHGEPQKQTEIGLVPESWKVVKLGSIVNFQTGKLNSNAATPDGEYPFFTCSQETLRIDHYVFDTEAILLSGNNAQGIYSVKHFTGKFNAYQRTYVITLKDKKLLPYTFLHHALSQNLERLRTLSIGTSTKYLTMGVLQNLPIAKPLYEEAKDIGYRLQLVEKKLEQATKKKALLNDLCHTLLHRLMTAQIRVDQLDLSYLELRRQ